MREAGETAGIVGLVWGLAWILTAFAPSGCSLGGQLNGDTCYAGLASVHAITGPASLVLLAASAVFLALTRRR